MRIRVSPPPGFSSAFRGAAVLAAPHHQFFVRHRVAVPDIFSYIHPNTTGVSPWLFTYLPAESPLCDAVIQRIYFPIPLPEARHSFRSIGIPIMIPNEC